MITRFRGATIWLHKLPAGAADGAAHPLVGDGFLVERGIARELLQSLLVMSDRALGDRQVLVGIVAMLTLKQQAPFPVARSREAGLCRGALAVPCPSPKPRPPGKWLICRPLSVPTARLRVLCVLVVLAHHRQRVVHFNVAEHPTAAWTTQQIVDAFPDDSAPSYLLRDRDSVYGHVFRQRLKGMGVGDVLTAPHSHGRTRSQSASSAPARVSESRRRPRRIPPASYPGSLLRVLPRGAHSPGARQGCAPRPAN
jgi:hypothetical protein